MKARLLAPVAGLLTATMVLAGCGAGGDRESESGGEGVDQ